jgi:hypothetical protein
VGVWYWPGVLRGLYRAMNAIDCRARLRGRFLRIQGGGVKD